jgi:pimeloyl-ACP methyl ester carboxylesterase
MHREAQTRRPRYPDEASAFSRMREKNPYLTDDQVAYLTHHALRANGDGTLSWKFDPRLNIWPLLDFSRREVEQMWQAITCPILFFHGSDTFMPNPASDGTLAHFAHARLINYDRASHWLHHDRLDDFVADLRAFLAAG